MGSQLKLRSASHGLLLALVLMCSTVQAAVPHLVRYQGQAIDSKGVPLEGPYTLTFRLYNAETAGTVVWQEQQANVPINKGHFSVLLGQVTALNVDWSQSLWLSIQVGTDPELLPRQRITSVPLAIRAEVAEGLVTPVTTSTITDDASRLMPSGAIILWDGASCPAGYTRLTTYDDKFLVASSTAGTTGGSDFVALTVAQVPAHTHTGSSHTHSTPAHTHTVELYRYTGSGSDNRVQIMEQGLLQFAFRGTQATGSPIGTGEGGGVTAIGGTESTGSTGGGQQFDNRPIFKTILLCKKD